MATFDPALLRHTAELAVEHLRSMMAARFPILSAEAALAVLASSTLVAPLGPPRRRLRTTWRLHSSRSLTNHAN